MAEKLLTVLKSGARPGERTFAFTARARRFRATPNILITQIGMILGTIVIWGLIVWIGMIGGFGGRTMSMSTSSVVLGALATVYSIFTLIRYPRELASLAKNLGNLVIIDGVQYWVQVGPDRLPAEFISLKRGSFLIYDAFSGLNVWRLHLRVGHEDHFFDPSAMEEIMRPTPYPRL